MIFQLLLILSYFQSSDRFAPPEGSLSGRELFEFRQHVLEDRFDELEKRWKANCDPSGQVALEAKTDLWSNNVAFELRGVLASTVVDQIGVSIETSIYERENKKQVEQLPRKLAAQIVGNDIRRICTDLPIIAQELNGLSVDSSQKACLFVQFRVQKVDVKPQCWMIIEIAAVPKDWPMYPASVFHRLKSRRNPITILQPHPEYELMLKAAADRLKKPLEANRPSILDQFKPPLPPLPDDDLSNAQRELLFDFSLLDDVRKDRMQIEQVTIFGDDRLSSSDIFSNLNRRLSPGTVVSYDELNKICAEFSSRCRNVKLYDGYHIMFVVTPFQHGKFEYAQVAVQLTKSE